MLGVWLAALLLAAPAAAADLSGKWVVSDAPDFPGVKLVTIAGAGGTILSDWYGELPLLGVREEKGGLAFEIYNGNPRIRRINFTLTPDGKAATLSGVAQGQAFKAKARRATAAEARALAFVPEKLPELRDLPDDGLARTPPMGWSSWNKFEDKIDDKTVRAMADALVSSGLRDRGYVYVNIDDGWQGKRDASGVLQPNERFPDMKALGDYIHARGLKFGIYSSPGPKTCAGYPGSYGHVEQDAKTWAAWGVDYVKYDLCSGEGFYNRYETVRATYQQMGEALRATGRQILYSLCQYGRFDVGAWGRKAGGHLWRTTRDITDDYPNMAGIGFGGNGRPEYNGPGGWNDPDMLEIGNGGLNADEARTHMTLWAIQAAPLMLGNDLSAMTPETLATLSNREVLAIDQDVLGVQGQRAHLDRATEVWTKRMADGSTAVAMFNRGDKPQGVVAIWSQIGLPDNGQVRDLWAGKDLGRTGTNFVANIPARGAMLLRVKP